MIIDIYNWEVFQLNIPKPVQHIICRATASANFVNLMSRKHILYMHPLETAGYAFNRWKTWTIWTNWTALYVTRWRSSQVITPAQNVERFTAPCKVLICTPCHINRPVTTLEERTLAAEARSVVICELNQFPTWIEARFELIDMRHVLEHYVNAIAEIFHDMATIIHDNALIKWLPEWQRRAFDADSLDLDRRALTVSLGPSVAYGRKTAQELCGHARCWFCLRTLRQWFQLSQIGR